MCNQKCVSYLFLLDFCISLLGEAENHEIAHFHLKAACYFAKLQLITAWFLQSCWLATHTYVAIWLS